jgi:CheY-like chemotaxis protein
MDGVDLVERIRLNHPTMPVIVTSGYARELSKHLQKLAPPTVFIKKPYRLSEIVRTLEKLTSDGSDKR